MRRRIRRAMAPDMVAMMIIVDLGRLVSVDVAVNPEDV
jgi:hypothetical protein